MNDDASNIIDLLVDETFKHVSISQNITHLKIEKRFEHFDIFYLRGIYHPATRMLRFKSKDLILDIPSNWHIFDINKLNEETNRKVDKSDNEFFHVLKSMAPYVLDKIVLLEKEGICYLVFLRSGEDDLLSKLLEENEIRQAA